MNNRIYKKLLEMMSYRGYNISDNGKYSDRFEEDDYFEIFESKECKMGIMYIESDKNRDYIGAASLRIFIKRILEENLRKCMLVSTSPLGVKTRPIILHFTAYLSIEFITIADLKDCPFDNYLCKKPKQIKNIEEFKTKWGIKKPKKELIRILDTDPLCKRFGFGEGDIIYTENKNEDDFVYMYVTKI